MPSLLLLVPCERVQYDSVDKSTSVIGILQGYTITTSSTPPPPDRFPADMRVIAPGQDSSLPFRWVIFTLWRQTPDDKGKQFIQSCEFVKPNGKSQQLHEVPFRMDSQFHRITLNANGFPVDEQGDYKIRLFLKTEGGEPVFIQEYPISVRYVEETNETS